MRYRDEGFWAPTLGLCRGMTGLKTTMACDCATSTGGAEDHAALVGSVAATRCEGRLLAPGGPAVPLQVSTSGTGDPSTLRVSVGTTGCGGRFLTPGEPTAPLQTSTGELTAGLIRGPKASIGDADELPTDVS